MRATTGFLCVVIAVIGFGAWAPAAESPGEAAGEKLLFGFEREEAEKASKSELINSKLRANAFKELENGAFGFFRNNHPFFHERELDAIRPMRCVPGKASQGEYACRVAETFNDRRNLVSYPSFRLPRIGVLSLHQGAPQANLRTPELFNTSGWFASAIPADWSGYDLLRVDLLVETVDQVNRLMLEVEDELVEPPVSLTYAAPPAGKWVTLQMDLAVAVKERGLDLKKISNIYVRVDLKDAEKNAREMHALRKDPDALDKRKFLAYVDNIRLARKGAPCANPVLEGTRSVYTATLPRSYATDETHTPKNPITRFEWPDMFPVETTMPEPAAIEPDRAPVKLGAPSVIPIQDMILKGCFKDSSKNKNIHNTVRLTCTAAFDTRRMVVGFYIMGMGNFKASPEATKLVARHTTAVVQTLDGGKTWTGLGGAEYPTAMGGNTSKLPFRLVDIGPDVIGATYYGCSAIVGAHIGYPADRAFMVRTVFTGEGWWKSPKYFITGDPRHCHDIEHGDFALLPSGRIWFAFIGKGRAWYEAGKHLSYAYYSDDRGATWCSWRGPGLVGSMPKLKGKYLRVAPYRGNIAVFGSKVWSWYDGEKWAAIEKTGVTSDGTWHAVSCGEEIYLANRKGPTRWYDGTSWNDFTVPGRTGTRGKMGLCGGKTLVFVESDASKKKLLCWRKEEGGEWKGPQELLTEKTEISKIATQRCAPENFLPVAYMCESSDPTATAKGKIWPFADMDPFKVTPLEPWIKVLNVPVKGE